MEAFYGQPSSREDFSARLSPPPPVAPPPSPQYSPPPSPRSWENERENAGQDFCWHSWPGQTGPEYTPESSCHICRLISTTTAQNVELMSAFRTEMAIGSVKRPEPVAVLSPTAGDYPGLTEDLCHNGAFTTSPKSYAFASQSSSLLSQRLDAEIKSLEYERREAHRYARIYDVDSSNAFAGGFPTLVDPRPHHPERKDSLPYQSGQVIVQDFPTAPLPIPSPGSAYVRRQPVTDGRWPATPTLSSGTGSPASGWIFAAGAYLPSLRSVASDQSVNRESVAAQPNVSVWEADDDDERTGLRGGVRSFMSGSFFLEAFKFKAQNRWEKCKGGQESFRKWMTRAMTCGYAGVDEQ